MKHIFIINPYAGAGTRDNSERIRKILMKKENFEYLVFDTEYKGHETELAERMCNLFADEYIRFYACGGSGTFANILNGIQDFEKTEIAYYPLGMSSDFGKCFGSDQVHFYNLNKLIDGEPMYMDILEFGKYRAINAFSTGVDAAVARDVDKFRIFSYLRNGLAYKISGLKNFLLPRAKCYEVEIDGKRYDGKYTLIYIGNGICYGGKYFPLDTANPCDGEAELIMVRPMRLFEIFKLLRHYEEGDRKKIEEFAQIVNGSEFRIKIAGKKEMLCSFDGEIIELMEMEGRLCTRKLRMIVPKGVTIKPAKHVKEALHCGRKS